MAICATPGDALCYPSAYPLQCPTASSGAARAAVVPRRYATRGHAQTDADDTDDAAPFSDAAPFFAQGDGQPYLAKTPPNHRISMRTGTKVPPTMPPTRAPVLSDVPLEVESTKVSQDCANNH